MVNKDSAAGDQTPVSGDENAEIDTTPLLTTIIPSSHPEVARRLTYYGNATSGDFRKTLHGVVFVSCGKAHEMTRKDCGMSTINGRCAHQRPSNDPRSPNAFTTIRDALLFSHAYGKKISVDATIDPREKTSPLFPIWRNLLALDAVAGAARACIEWHNLGIVPATAHPAILDRRAFVASLKILEADRASPLELLHQEAKLLFDEVLTETMSLQKFRWSNV